VFFGILSGSPRGGREEGGHLVFLLSDLGEFKVFGGLGFVRS
jgi:hypothetical protein